MSSTFAKPPINRVFSAAPKAKRNERNLVAVLDKHERDTHTVPILRAKDVLLNSSGLVQGRYSLSTVALKTLCSKLAPGLGQAMSSLAGLNQNESEVDQQRAISVECAIRWLNDAIRLRFDDIEGFNMVIDVRTRCVDGFVGRSYKFFPNKELYEHACQFISQMEEPHIFWEAVLSGRRFMLRFRSKKKVFSVPVPEWHRNEPFYGGFHFANSEVGECSLRAAAICLRKWTDCKAISPFCDGGKMAHIRGPAFERRFKRLLEQVGKRASEMSEFKSYIIRLKSTTLNLGGSKNDHEKQLSKITAKLNKKGLPARFSRAAMLRMLELGSYSFAALQRSQDPMQVYAGRTVYDLFNSIAAEAKNKDPELREKAEQIAYEILSGRLSFH